MASPSPAPEELLTVDRLVAATEQRQLYRLRGAAGDQALLLLPRAFASAPGWADRLRALAVQGQPIQAAGAVPFTRAGSVAQVAALARPWLDGIGARTFAKSKADGLPPLFVILALVEAATALEQLHAAGLCHGRIAPENAILGSDGRLVLVDVGLWPALTGKPGTEAQDIRDFARMAYRWLAGRDVPGEPDELPPLDLLPPSRLDRRVPAQADPLILRALQAGTPRGLAKARELAQGLRQVLRSAGAAVSPGDIAGWAQSHPAADGPEVPVKPLLAPGQPIGWQPLVERAVQRPAPLPYEGEPDTVRDAPQIPIAASLRGPASPAPIRSPGPVPALGRMDEGSQPSQSGESHGSQTSASIVRDRRWQRLRSLGGFGLALGVVGGGAAVFFAVTGHGNRSRRAGSPPPGTPLFAPPSPAVPVKPPPPPPPQYQPPPLPL
ncbi:MAG: serine/threonine-protein kinase, partial [Deltaproteobacteria bacterium]